MRIGLAWLRKPSPFNSYRDFFNKRYLYLHRESMVLEEHIKGTRNGLISGGTVSLAAFAGILLAGLSNYLFIGIPALFLLTHAAITYTRLLPSHKKCGEEAATLESGKHAWWSIRGDHEMCIKYWRGTLRKEFKKNGIEVPAILREPENK